MVSNAWGYICDGCSASDSGYVSEIAARRVEIAHLESGDCTAPPGARMHLEFQVKRNRLAELELEARNG